MEKHLKSQYGFTNFRDLQKDIITDILEKNDSIVIFPTGGGKSLCYQFPATYLNKKSIILTCLFKSIAQSGLVRTKIEGLSTVVSLVAFKFKVTGTWGSYADPTQIFVASAKFPY